MSLVDYKALLKSYSDFQESILLDYWSEDLCRTFTVLISNLWKSEGMMRDNLDEHAPVYLRFEQCQRVLIENNFSQYQLDHPDDRNWSISEFSSMRTQNLENGMVRFQFLWEDERKIEIDCYSLSIEEVPNTPEIQARYAWPYLRPADPNAIFDENGYPLS